MKILLNSRIIATALIILLAVTAAEPRQKETDYKKINSGLNLIEKVISTVMAEKDIKDYFSLESVNGAYVEGYGVVFLMSLSTRNFRAEKAIKARESFDLMRDRLRQVFPDYISRLKDIRPNDNIIMAVTPSTKSLTRWTGSKSSKSPYKGEEFKPYSFTLSARRSEILRGNPAETVKFQAAGGDGGLITPGTDYDLRILRGIIEQAIEDDFKTSLSASNVQAVMLKGFGVLVTVKTGGRFYSSGPRVTVVTDGKLITETMRDGEKRVRIVIDEPERFINRATKLQTVQEAKKSLEERREDFVARITEVLGDFGTTIDGMKSSDVFAVQFTSRDYRWDLVEDINVMITIPFKEIQNYFNGRLSLSGLRNKVTTKVLQ